MQNVLKPMPRRGLRGALPDPLMERDMNEGKRVVSTGTPFDHEREAQKAAREYEATEHQGHLPNREKYNPLSGHIRCVSLPSQKAPAKQARLGRNSDAL